MVGLKIDFCFLLRWYVTARIGLSLVGLHSPVGFKYGVFATTLSVRAVFNWVLKRIGWSEPQVDTDMHLKQCCRHLAFVEMVLHAFFGDCVLWLFHVRFLWTWCCIHSFRGEPAESVANCCLSVQLKSVDLHVFVWSNSMTDDLILVRVSSYMHDRAIWNFRGGSCASLVPAWVFDGCFLVLE